MSEHGVAPPSGRCYAQIVPTTQPRYTITDTGEMREMLDLAHRRWPEVKDRRQLLLRLAGEGAKQIACELDATTAESRRQRQLLALARAPELIDAETLLADAAWR
jgi:hypothetical protein